MSRPSSTSTPSLPRTTARSQVVPWAVLSLHSAQIALRRHHSTQKSPLRMAALRVSFRVNYLFSKRSANMRVPQPSLLGIAPIPAPPVNPIDSYSFADVPSKPFRVYLFRKHGGGWGTAPSPPYCLIAWSVLAHREQRRRRRGLCSNLIQLGIRLPQRFRHRYLDSFEDADQLQRVHHAFAQIVVVGHHIGALRRGTYRLHAFGPGSQLVFG